MNSWMRRKGSPLPRYPEVKGRVVCRAWLWGVQAWLLKSRCGPLLLLCGPGQLPYLSEHSASLAGMGDGHRVTVGHVGLGTKGSCCTLIPFSGFLEDLLMGPPRRPHGEV